MHQELHHRRRQDRRRRRAAVDVTTRVVKQETDKQNWLVNNNGDENPYLLWQEMGKWMTDNCTVVRHNEQLEKTLEQCQEWKERYKRVKLSDTGMWTNQNLSLRPRHCAT